jgi:hypothetical protein
MTQITYNNANAEERTKQLRNAKVEEDWDHVFSKLMNILLFVARN